MTENRHRVPQIGIHVLTAYPPSNPNRDEHGEPKTAIVNGVLRQRISSQCIKRAWRLSPLMATFEKSIRTRGVGLELLDTMVKAGIEYKIAKEYATAMARMFGKINEKKSPEHKEMIVIGHEEYMAAKVLTERLIKERRSPNERELLKLQQETTSADVALFGRLRAATVKFNVDSAVSVSHPLTTGKAYLDSDFWTAADDLKTLDDEASPGSGGMGEVEFGSGVFYTYVQINLEILKRNLGVDAAQSKELIAALIEAVATVAPSGHRTTFGNVVRSSYLRIEIGEPSGNLYCKAFENPVSGTESSIHKLQLIANEEAQGFDLRQQVFEFLPPQSLTKTIQAAMGSLEIN